MAGSLVQAGVPQPTFDGALRVITIPSSLQVPALLLTALVCGPRSALLAAVAYISLGLSQLSVFQGGGGLGYVLEPGFGYLAGFLPASWLSGRLAQQQGMNHLMSLFSASLVGLAALQLCGIANLLIGAAAGRWGPNLWAHLFTYSLAPLVPQILMCCPVALLALGLRRLLLIGP